MKLKQLIRQYGIVFFGTYAISFILLVAIHGKLKLGHVPGDIAIGDTFYLPIVSSLAIAAFTTIILEFYKFTK